MRQTTSNSAAAPHAAADPHGDDRGIYAAWKGAPEAFCVEAARDLTWYQIWDKAAQYGRWFTAYNCLDRSVENGRAQQKALIYDSPVTDTTRAATPTPS